MNRSILLSIISPVLVIGTLQAGGCLRRAPAPPPPGGTYLSESAGASFKQSVTLTGPEVAEGSHIARFNLQGSFRSKQKPETVYIAAGDQGLVVSHDEGKTWQQIATPLTSAVDVALLENGVLVATGTGPEGQGFILRSLDNGLSWQTVLTIPIPTDEGPFRIIGSRTIQAAIILTIELDPFDGNRLYAGSNLGGMLVGEQSGKVWRTIHTLTPERFDPSQSSSRSSVEKLVPSPHTRGEVVVITAENRLWRVTKDGQTKITIPVEQTEQEKKFFISKGDHEIKDVAFSRTNSNLLLAGVEGGVLLSRDAGSTWETLPVPVQSVITFNTIRASISPTNPNRFLVGINNVVYRSEDAGATWNTFSLGLPAHKITDILINPKNAAKVLLLTAPLEA